MGAVVLESSQGKPWCILKYQGSELGGAGGNGWITLAQGLLSTDSPGNERFFPAGGSGSPRWFVDEPNARAACTALF